MDARIFRPDETGSAAVLGPLESLILNAVWVIDRPVTVGDIAGWLKLAGHHVHYSSAKTTLNTLTSKGYLKKRSMGRANAFAAAVSKDEFERRVVGGVLSGLLRNYRSPLIASLAETMAHDAESLAEFERLLAAQREARAE